MSETTTHIPEEKSRIGAPSIPGFTEEGENLSPINDNDGSPLGGASSKAHSHGGGVGVPDSSRAGRLTSYKVEDFAKLTGREEDWRFTPLKRLKGLHTDELTGAAPKVELTGSDAVVLTEVAADDVLNGIAHTPDDRVSANAWKYASSTQVVTVPKGAEGVQATLRITGESMDAAAQHIIVVAEENTEATIILDHVGSAVLAQNVEFDVRADARLTVISLQAWENDAVHASSQQALVAQGASFKHIVVTFGGDLVRVNPSARFTGERAEIELYGLYFADAGQHLEHRLFVDHAVANCKSNVLYKGALQGKDAHTVWVGDVLIQKAAVGTDSYEANRNLVLTDGARADSVPNLEIETGLIDGAGHASTTGRFDDEHLFYLMARGIDEKTARRLVVRGFLNEIVQQIGDEALQERLTETIEMELAATEN
ncbi:Fe-S cluster assembly protein SufD [Glutamicibacter protophormiae]|uniref:Fe-S cluster assembly protein SufD n=1 Tax=Glutamicibacter protophormiae TaxID=37930 RepID=A0ABS4XTU4_GLUPR|nr:Fe-S cluster assembly protein SufD [Glutamicibacter protophormiae]MBP2399918.1 Fe-S cluster assembly protein SufD [Glutamicibacter protophormiae]QRQ77255.1 Fe-S cluster assembly protein SufD [Glutamicibacter protophormiae]WPR63235.1 Fe-S cluster assembly protein SufD [Glutamicibacter protophormiae]WPR66731.1 Fe-S cluster assembly protein SufD [Glutamicibacter protophormiae]GGL76696.1 Fe-S cluster assembly protein SufD [Glutamicibacter protophormiae]